MSRRRPLHLLVMIAVVLAGLVGLTPAFAVATAPTFEPDPNSLGAVTLFDATGNVVTNGSTTTAPFAAFAQAAVARGNVAHPDTKASLYLASPTKDDPATWSKTLIGSASVYPNSAAPGPLGTSALPLYTGHAADSTLASLVTNLPTTAYAGIYQVRVYTNGPGNTLGSVYDSLDVMIDSTANTFQAIYPVIVPVVSTVGVDATSPAAAGTTENLSATVSPSGLAGTVAFLDGTTPLGTATYTQTTGAATLATAIPSGVHSLSAVFTPTDTMAIANATSAMNTSFTVSPAATTTSVVSVSPASPAPAGTSETLSATVAPAGSAGSVVFSDSGTALTGTVTYTASTGAASLTVTLPSGAHSLTAAYTPADSTVTSTSASASATSYTVNAAAAGTATTTSLVSVSPVSPATAGSSQTLSATVAPAGSAGSVTFLDAGTVLTGTVTYTASSGVASLAVTLPSGTHSLSASYAPADASTTASSSASPTSYTVSAPAANAPAYEPDPNSLGALTLYDASGNVVTSGSTTSAPFAAYVQAAIARTAAHADTKASLYLASPTKDDPSTWSKSLLGAASVYPNSAAPGSLGTSALPLYTGHAADSTIASLVTNLPTTAYAGVYQLRIYTNGPGNTQGSVYDSLDIMIDSTANTFQVIYPQPAVVTTQTSVSAVTLDTSSPAAPGTTETLSATVSPSNVAGSVVFKDGTATLAGSVTYTPSTGIASLSTVLPAGDHLLAAVFTPTATGYSGSSSTSTTAFTVSAPVATSLLLSSVPSGTQVDGQPTTFTATIMPSNATGSVAFYDGSANIGTTGLVAGSAVDTITLVGQGDHEISAIYTPLNAAGFSGSMSNTLSFTVTEPVVAGPPSTTPVVVVVVPVVVATPIPGVILAPGLSGGGKVGNVESCKSGEFSNVTSFLYTFVVSGATVQNASPFSTYLIKPGDLGKRLSCLVTAIGPGGQHRVGTQSVTVGIGTLLVHKGSSIKGRTTKGSTLKVVFGTYSAHPMKYTVQWLRDGKAIKGATHAPYKLGSADVGHKISCKVTAIDKGYKSLTTSTKSTRKIAL